jgi:uncharacterized SAM-binding protein YcdF (DUF218 family)
MPGMPIWRLADPMLLLLLLLGAGLWIVTRRRRLLRDRRVRWPIRVTWAAWALLFCLTSPGCSGYFLYAVQERSADLDTALAGKDPERRVLLVFTGGSLRPPAPGLLASELIGDAAYPRALGAARAYRRYGFSRVIVSGSATPSLTHWWGMYSVLGMAEVAEHYGVPRERLVLETISTNTRENAAFSALLARAYGAEEVVVVTSAYHMPRALAELERAGVHALPLSVEFSGLPGTLPSLWLPSVYGLQALHLAIHEVLGRLKP